MRHKKFTESALHSRCERVLQGSTVPKIPSYTFRGSSAKLPSHSSIGNIDTFKKEVVRYTGESILGIATLHKSNAVPVFSEQEAVEISKMRKS